MENGEPQTHAPRNILTVCGAWLVGLGLYFAFLRPALLPEDLRYLGTTSVQVLSTMPRLADWLHRVFTVMGGFMMGAGALTIVVALNLARLPKRPLIIAVAAAGLSTVGFMAVTNFLLGSDFKWLLSVPALLWATGVAVLQRTGRHLHVHGSR